MGSAGGDATLLPVGVLYGSNCWNTRAIHRTTICGGGQITEGKGVGLQRGGGTLQKPFQPGQRVTRKNMGGGGLAI